MELSERKLRILQAIVGDFIRSAEPVGSRTLSKKLDMGISPATIRNEMSDLEEMGFFDASPYICGKSSFRQSISPLCEQPDAAI
jgi:transcriptional regulator of heat shock response